MSNLLTHSREWLRTFLYTKEEDKRNFDSLPVYYKNGILSMHQCALDPFDINSYSYKNDEPAYAISGQGLFIDTTNKTIQLKARQGFATKGDIVNINYYRLEFDFYAPYSNRKYIIFCTSDIDSNVGWTTKNGVQIGVDIGNTYHSVIKNGTSVGSASYNNNVMGFSGTKHVIFIRNGDTASLKIGDTQINNLDVSGLPNGFGGRKWNDGSFTISNIKIEAI